VNATSCHPNRMQILFTCYLERDVIVLLLWNSLMWLLRVSHLFMPSTSPSFLLRLGWIVFSVSLKKVFGLGQKQIWCRSKKNWSWSKFCWSRQKCFLINFLAILSDSKYFFFFLHFFFKRSPGGKGNHPQKIHSKSFLLLETPCKTSEPCVTSFYLKCL
jgi:hypothetical protein